MMGCHMHGEGLSEGRKERKRRKFSTFLTGRDNKLPTNSAGKITTRNRVELLRQELKRRGLIRQSPQFSSPKRELRYIMSPSASSLYEHQQGY
ncbi:uncharacterized [Tachysurus ichikawai]